MKFPVRVLAFFVATAASGFEIQEISLSPDQVKLGSPLRLRCKSDSRYEYCIWRHQDWVCEFEWIRRLDEVVKKVKKLGLSATEPEKWVTFCS